MTVREKVWELYRQILILERKENKTKEEEKRYQDLRDMYQEYKQWAE